MELIIEETSEQLAKAIADRLIELVTPLSNPLISPASGDSPAGAYAELVKRVSKNEIDASNWNFIGLDEWGGMNGDDEGSCRFHLNQQLFNPLGIRKEKICFFDGRIKDLSEECKLADDFIKANGPIDVAIVGLGMNGHIGMNEPGTDPELGSHVTEIAEQTQQVGQKYFTSAKKLSNGVTLGISTLMQAKNIFLIVTGSHKASIVQELFLAEVSPALPGTFLRKHPGLVIFLDKAAAQLILQHEE